MSSKARAIETGSERYGVSIHDSSKKFLKFELQNLYNTEFLEASKFARRDDDDFTDNLSLSGTELDD